MTDVSGYTTIAFDLDDTLFDHRGSAAAACLDWCSELGMESTSLEKEATRWLALEAEAFELYRSGQISFQDQRRLRIRQFLPDADHWGDEQADRAFAAYLSLYRSRWSAFPDAAPALAVLRENGHHLCVFTNGDRAQQHEKVKAIGLELLIDGLFVSSELPAPKPDPSSFSAVATAMGAAPSECLMVGDNLATDVLSAARCGWGALWLDRRPLQPRTLDNNLATLPSNVRVIHSLSALLS